MGVPGNLGNGRFISSGNRMKFNGIGKWDIKKWKGQYFTTKDFGFKREMKNKVLREMCGSRDTFSFSIFLSMRPENMHMLMLRRWQGGRGKDSRK